MPDRPDIPEPTPDGRILIYRDGATRLKVRLEGRTAWLSPSMNSFAVDCMRGLVGEFTIRPRSLFDRYH